MNTLTIKLTLIHRALGGYDGSFTGYAACGSETRTVKTLNNALCIVSLAHNSPVVSQNEDGTIYCFATQKARQQWLLDRRSENAEGLNRADLEHCLGIIDIDTNT